MYMNNNILGNLIKEKREENNYSINELSNLVGISHAELRRIETGERRVPNLMTLIYICKILGLNMMNILKISGLMDEYNSNIYMIEVSKKDVKRYKVFADNEEEAIDRLSYYLDNNNVYDLNKEEDYTYEIVNSLEHNNEEINDDVITLEGCISCKYYCNSCGKCHYSDE